MSIYYMRTINRNPIKTIVSDELYIIWKCHGIDINGNRRHWIERSATRRWSDHLGNITRSTHTYINGRKKSEVLIMESELIEEAETQRQEDIDEYNNQRMADCADACGLTHFELFELAQRPDYIDESEQS